ncbi:MAG TPA: acetate--CoA ligase [Gaiellaceae bacterium]
MNNTDPESTVPPAGPGDVGAGLRPAEDGAGEVRGGSIDTMFLEDRRYPPDPEFAAQANAQPELYELDMEELWAREAQRITWFERWTTLLEWEPPYAKWYLGGKLNVCFNCVDRHVEAGRGGKVAYHWEGEPEGDRRDLTYADLQGEVVRFANALRELGVRKGTKVAIYMGMVPELAIAMLACTRLGAPHTVVFGGFSADSLSDRINDMGCTVLVTQDEAWRRGSKVPLKQIADEALDNTPGIETVVVLRRTGGDVPMRDGRDRFWDEVVEGKPDDPESCPPEPMDSEDLLFLMYTSGTTAKPKGIAHTTGGYLVGIAATHHYIFDVKRDDDVYWCAADIGWITGHSYIVYGPLANGSTSVIYEGTPDYPDKDRWWDIVERYGVTILYTAPTAIRAHMKWGPDHAAKHDLSSLRLLGSVGEPINPEAWMWYREHVGGNRTPVVDTWWQTETGMILITPLPGLTTTKPGSATKPFPGVDAAVFDEQGNEVGPGGGGYLVLRKPWPAMLRGIYGDEKRYVQTYWSKYPGVYFAGDGARIDEDGDFWLLGRVDDVMNVSGHRISTIEIESALVDHPSVAEAAVCGRIDSQTGQAIVAFVTLKGGEEGTEERLAELRDHVGHKIGPIAKPANIVFTPELPKTRSGKIMRRLLRDVAENRPLGDTTTLADPAVVEEIRERGTTEGREE